MVQSCALDLGLAILKHICNEKLHQARMKHFFFCNYGQTLWTVTL